MSMQKISLMLILDETHPKIIKVIFNFPEFASACKKSAQSIHSFLWYSRLYNPMT